MISKNIRAYKLSRYELRYIDKLYSFYMTKISISDSYRLPEIYEGNFLEFKQNNLGDIRENDKILISDNVESLVSDYYGLGEYANPDFLGFYTYSKGEEGKIFLYKDRILECSHRISKNLNLDYQKTISILKFIVLFHELGHWFSHWVCKDENDINFEFFNRLSIETIESIAQLNVLWAIHGHKNIFVKEIRDVFFYLVDRQPREYQKFLLCDKMKANLKNEKSFTSRTTILNRFLNLIEYSNFHKISDDFIYLISGKKEEF